MAGRAKEFIDLYNEFKDLLSKKFNVPHDQESFPPLILLARDNHLINSREIPSLELIGRLRNAIIHDSKHKYPDDPIAEPHADVIDKLRKIKERIEKPPLVEGLLKPELRVFKESDSFLECLAYMHQKDYSQVIVSLGKRYGVLTREDVARWFEEHIENKEICLSLENITLQDIFPVIEEASCVFLERDAVLQKLVDLFTETRKEKISAVLITAHGNASEKPLTIVTQYDLPEIVKKIGTL